MSPTSCQGAHLNHHHEGFYNPSQQIPSHFMCPGSRPLVTNCPQQNLSSLHFPARSPPGVSILVKRKIRKVSIQDEFKIYYIKLLSHKCRKNLKFYSNFLINTTNQNGKSVTGDLHCTKRQNLNLEGKYL